MHPIQRVTEDVGRLLADNQVDVTDDSLTAASFNCDIWKMDLIHVFYG